ncbi:hypothetical protein K4K97_13185 [Phaeobacter inhibens]|uniref:hypothetical protein n=1 Tax=Phaeobacter inhibens TaxID=221822 RepID=UPI0021A8A5FB|nr:hypothetical protein [Phaeobacter inhibens]UWR79550.1 hypothetical protein K4K97_13185 [Phaeobacter inhibens]
MQHEADREKLLYDLNIEYAKRAHDLNRQTSSEFSRAAIESANVTIRAFILVNGGAVVALLAFIGALEATEAGGEAKIDELILPLLLFSFGVGSSIVTAALAYLVNMLDHDITNSVQLTWEHPYVQDDDDAERLRRRRQRFHKVAITIALITVFLFFAGVFTVANAISNLDI